MGNLHFLQTNTGFNINIASPTGIATYIADDERAIFCDFSLYGVAGNGDYVGYVTRKISGSASANVVLPKTTMTAASGETNIGGQSGLVSVGNGDTLIAYVDGLAGDTSITGTSVRWSDLYALQSTVYGRSLDVNANGEAGIDWGNIGNQNTIVGLSGTFVNSNVVQISGDATAADNLELQFDGTGLSGDTYPSTQAQILNIAIAGSPSYEAASSYVLSTGTQSAGTYLNTDTSNSVYHTHTDNGGLLDFYYEFTLAGDEVATSVVFKGRITGVNDSVFVQAYDWTNSLWVSLFTLAGTAGTTDTSQNPALVGKYTGTGLNDGKVRVRIVNAVTLTTATMFIDQLIVGKTITSRTVGYQDGAVWVKAAGSSGTANFINGTADNPCPWADAQTIATSLGLTRFRIVNGETLTLTGATDNKALIGRSWTLLLNGQSISGSYIEGASVFGVCSGSAKATYVDCDLLAGTFPPSKMLRCGVGSSGTFTAASAGNYDFIDCYSLVPGAGTPAFTFSGLGSATGIQFRRWSGGTNITLDSNCTMSVESVSAGTQTLVTGGANSEYRGIFKGFSITSSGTSTTNVRGVSGPLTIAGTAGTVTIAGVCGTITDSSLGAVTITNTAVNLPNINVEVLDVMNVDTYVEPGQGAPAATASLATKINYIYKTWRNKKTQTATTRSIFADDGVTVDHKATDSDDGTTYTKGEMGTGP